VTTAVTPGRSGGLQGTSRRIAFSLGGLVIVFGAASALAFAGMNEIHTGLHDVKRHNEQVRSALELGSAVRDMYAHQAHTIILGNETHLAFYEEAHARVLRLLQAVQAQPGPPVRQELLQSFEVSVRELDRVFRDRIIPAVQTGNSAVVRDEHSRAQELAGRLQAQADDLAQLSLGSIGGFEQHAVAVQHATFLWTLLMLIGATVAAALIGIFLGRSVIRPLATLRDGAARIERGDLSTRIELDRTDEFGALATQFNAMTAALQEHQEKLVQQEKLAGIGRLAAGVAHEINNPLSVILGYTRLLKNRAQGELADELATIEAEAVRCQHIVEDLLDLSRPLAIAGDPVDLRPLCEDVVARLCEAGPLARVDVGIRGEGQVRGSAERLRQIVTNLLRNAAEAAGQGGRVQLTLSRQSEHVRLEVTDSGPGIPSSARARLFEPFFTTKPTGIGLGLAVSQAIAHAHGGRIEAANAPSGGALFTLSLPGSDARPA
jgi:signal transduction histidine kinase